MHTNGLSPASSLVVLLAKIQVKKNQLLLLFSGVVLLAFLMVFGKTTGKKAPVPDAAKKAEMPAYDIEKQAVAAKKTLDAGQSARLSSLEKALEQAGTSESRELACRELARFWSDSADNHELFVFYTHKGAMLVNSEKSLTFAARQIFREMRNEEDPAIRIWKSDKARELFEKAGQQDPENDSLKTELAACHIFGPGMAGDASETMKGVQMLLGIVRKDSLNMQAQQLLGIGGVVSTQYEKAIGRLELVVSRMPENLEAVSWLADAYAGKGDVTNAVKWYNYSKKLVNNPEFSREIDRRIALLRQK